MKSSCTSVLGVAIFGLLLSGCGGGGGCADASCATGVSEGTGTFVTTASAIAISVGFDGTATSVDQDKRYGKTFAVSVANQQGFAVKGAVVTPQVVIPYFRKGFFVRNEDREIIGNNSLRCANEDVNGDNDLQLGEDTNGDGELTPRQSLMTVTPTSAVTDENGVAYFEVRYFKNYAGWLEYQFVANTAVQTTEGSTTVEAQTGYIIGDETEESAPFISSPFGVDVSSCANNK